MLKCKGLQTFGVNMASGVVAALAAGSLSFAKIHAHDIEKLKHTENALEKEILRETKAPPKGKVASQQISGDSVSHWYVTNSTEVAPGVITVDVILCRIRHNGERFLHSKHVLLVIVILNVIDCILVMGELIFDIHYIVDVLEKSEKASDNFITKMTTKYPLELHGVDDIDDLYKKLLKSTVEWNNNETDISEHTIFNLTQNNGTILYRYKRENSFRQTTNVAVKTKRKTKRKTKTVEEAIAHGFHKASITILAILVIETTFKIFCFGTHMLDNKLEVFDCFVVFISFTLDLVFIKGITIYTIQEFVFILAFLVPWRILRVVNSLIVTIIDHEHFRMKLLYMQKKQISIQMKEAKREMKLYENNLQAIEQLCLSNGIPEYRVRECMGELKRRKKKVFASCASLQDPNDTTPMIDDFEIENGNIAEFKYKAKSMDDVDLSRNDVC